MQSNPAVTFVVSLLILFRFVKRRYPLKHFLICIACILWPLACTSTRPGQSNTNSYQTLALQKYGEGVKFTPNTTGNLMLCVKAGEQTAQFPYPSAKFFVFELTTNKMLYEDEVGQGSVWWLNDREIKIRTISGILKDIEQREEGFRVDVFTGQKSRLNTGKPESNE